MIRTKSFVSSSSNSLDPSQALPERVGSSEIVQDACGERDVSHRKSHGDGGFDACIVCEVSDVSVLRCSGMDCPLWFHEECLTPEFGGNEDLSNPFCPYCWYKIVKTKSDSLREKVIEAERAVLKYLDKEKKSSESVSETLTGEQVVQGEKAADSSKEEQEADIGKLKNGTGEARYMAGDNANDVLNLLDDEDGEEVAEVSTCAVKNGDVLRLLSIQESSSGQEHDKVLKNDKQRRRTLVINLSDIDDEMSSSKERNEEDITEQIGSSLSSETSEEDVTEQIGSSLSSETNEEDKDKGKLETGTGEARYMAGDNANDVLNLLDDEDGEEVAEVSTCAVKNGDVLRLLSIQESSSGQEHDKVLQNDKQRRRTFVINLSDIEDEMSSSKERTEENVTEQISSSLSGETNEEDVTEQISSSLSIETNEEDVTVQIGSSKTHEEDFTEQIGSSETIEEDVTQQSGSSSSREANNQLSKLKATTIETTTIPKPVRTLPSRDVSFFKNNQRRVLWTSEEEKMLAVGVEIYAAEAKKNIPWKKILDWGSNVFHESRSSTDLKDKWRNMVKAAASALPKD